MCSAGSIHVSVSQLVTRRAMLSCTIRERGRRTEQCFFHHSFYRLLITYLPGLSFLLLFHSPSTVFCFFPPSLPPSFSPARSHYYFLLLASPFVFRPLSSTSNLPLYFFFSYPFSSTSPACQHSDMRRCVARARLAIGLYNSLLHFTNHCNLH